MVLTYGTKKNMICKISGGLKSLGLKSMEMREAPCLVDKTQLLSNKHPAVLSLKQCLYMKITLNNISLL